MIHVIFYRDLSTCGLVKMLFFFLLVLEEENGPWWRKHVALMITLKYQKMQWHFFHHALIGQNSNNINFKHEAMLEDSF